MSSSPALGIMPDRKTCYVIARAAFLRGACGMFDTTHSDAATVNALVSDSGSSMVNVVAPSVGGIVCGLMCLFLQDAAVGQRVKALLRGRDQALVIKASGNVTYGDFLVATTAKNLSPDYTAGDRIIARAVDPLTAPTSATLTEVDFDGINGFAQLVS